MSFTPDFRSYETGPYSFIYLYDTLHITNRSCKFSTKLVCNNKILEIVKIVYSIFEQLEIFELFVENKINETNRSHNNCSFIAFGKRVLNWERFNKCVKVQKSANVHIVLSKIHACKNETNKKQTKNIKKSNNISIRKNPFIRFVSSCIPGMLQFEKNCNFLNNFYRNSCKFLYRQIVKLIYFTTGNKISYFSKLTFQE